MTDAYRFDESSTEQAIAYAKIYAGENYFPAMETVLKVAFSEKRNLPTFRLKSSDTILLSGYMKKWVGAYLAGYNNRPSVRTGNCSGTHPDPMAKTILRARIPGLENNLADKIVAGHSLLMTIENNIGELLEEYLAVKLSPLGMVLLLGEYDRRGRLLQGGRLAAADKDKRQFRKQFQQQGQAGHSHRKMVPQVLEASGSI